MRTALNFPPIDPGTVYRIAPADYLELRIDGKFTNRLPGYKCRCQPEGTVGEPLAYLPRLSRQQAETLFGRKRVLSSGREFWGRAETAGQEIGYQGRLVPGAACGDFVGKAVVRFESDVEFQPPGIPFFSEPLIRELQLETLVVPVVIPFRKISYTYYLLDLPIVEVWLESDLAAHGCSRCPECSNVYVTDWSIELPGAYAFRRVQAHPLFQPKDLEGLVVCSTEFAERLSHVKPSGIRLEPMGRWV